jgi:hypothetical protein
MTPEHKKNIIPLLDEFWKLEVEKRIAEVYKDYQDLSSVYIGYYSVLEFGEYSKKAIMQISQLLQSKIFSILPFQYQFQNDFGAGNLRDDLAKFNSYVSNNNFKNAVIHLYRLVYYLVQNGFWQNDEPLDRNKEKQIIDELKTKLSIVIEQIDKNVNTNKKLIDELNIEKTNLITLISNKNKEFSEISNLLPTARKYSEEITRLLTNSTNTNQQITGLLNQQNANFDTIKEQIKQEKIVFDQFSADLKHLKESYTVQIDIIAKHNSTFEKQFETILDKSKTFEDRIMVLNELIGKEGAVKLFNTFNDRKKELEEPVKKWAKVVFGTGIFALALIIGIFTNFFGFVGGYPIAIDWQYLLVNSIKSVPVMIVLYFAIKQYIRERSYQEEYAFRSAIALTVQAYGDIAGSKKEELISKAVENIYNMPTMMKESNGLFSFKTRQLAEILKELNETIKNVKPS